MTHIIETDVDRLLELIEEKHKITAKEAAKILNVKEHQIRKWVEILEKNNLVKLKLNYFTMEIMSSHEEDAAGADKKDDLA